VTNYVDWDIKLIQFNYPRATRRNIVVNCVKKYAISAEQHKLSQISDANSGHRFVEKLLESVTGICAHVCIIVK